MNVVAIEDALSTWLSAVVSPVPVIWENQNAPPPSGGHVGMTHNAERAIGFNGYKSAPAGQQNTVSVTQDIEFMLMLNGYGSTGSAAIYKVLDAFQLPYQRNELYLAGIVYVSNEGIRNVAELVNSMIEERRALDIRMRIGNVLSYESNIIEHTDLGIVAKEGDRVVLDTTIHI